MHANKSGYRYIGRTVKTGPLFSRRLVANTRRSEDRENVAVMECVNVVVYAKNLVVPHVKARSCGSFATLAMAEGVLLASTKMKEAFSTHSELKVKRVQDIESHRLHLFTEKLEAE